MSERLSPKQVVNLINFVGDELTTSSFDLPNLFTKEISFTSNVVLPVVKGIVKKANKPGLYVRGDGSHPVKSIHHANLEFKPDISIGFHNDLHLAFEVKIIRNSDPSGSFAKAIGQGLTYRTIGGFDASFVLIFDLRRSAPLLSAPTKSLIESEIKNLFLYVW